MWRHATWWSLSFEFQQINCFIFSCQHKSLSISIIQISSADKRLSSWFPRIFQPTPFPMSCCARKVAIYERRICDSVLVKDNWLIISSVYCEIV